MEDKTHSNDQKETHNHPHHQHPHNNNNNLSHKHPHDSHNPHNKHIEQNSHNNHHHVCHKDLLETDENRKSTKEFSDDIKSWIKINNNMILLDFGTGTGLVGINFSKDVKKIIFQDVNKSIFEDVKKNCEKFNINNYEFFSDSIENYNKEKVDIITCSMCLHHIDNLENTLKTFLKILNSNGYLCIVDMLPVKVDKNDIPHHGFEPEKFKKLIQDCGFVNAEIKPGRDFLWKAPGEEGVIIKRFCLIAQAP